MGCICLYMYIVCAIICILCVLSFVYCVCYHLYIVCAIICILCVLSFVYCVCYHLYIVCAIICILCVLSFVYCVCGNVRTCNKLSGLKTAFSCPLCLYFSPCDRAILICIYNILYIQTI